MILVVGPGAVGGVLAARWAAAGKAVMLLGRTAAEETRLTRQGLSYAGADGRRRAVPRRLRSARRLGAAACEAAFFCVKSYDTAAAARAARRWIGPDTAVVALQNGVGHERVLRRAFGARRVVVGSCYFAADRPEPYHVTHTWGNDVLLAANQRNRESLAAAQRFLMEGGWHVHLKRSEERMLWTKLCFNAATNPLGALCAVTNSRLAEDPALREIMVKTLMEAVAVARKAGKQPLYSRMETLVVRACLNAPVQRNSMLQDLQEGRRTEIGAIAGPLLRAGRSLGVETPLLDKLSRLVRRMERP
ncbi:MAG: 2-dehydropantoate 2-reductase [Elusimicrobia bacterium]|nr:2-dehydropantoate 2-reductase [Elusimicrobiota bacterium]